MNIFELKIWDNERRLCTFYTVLVDGAQENETDKFLIKFENMNGFELATQELVSFALIGIGDEQGAVPELFNRDENEVKGLPVQGRIKLGELVYHYPEFPLRLYALNITDNIAILFNGGIKDGPTNQTSSLHTQWKEACYFAKELNLFCHMRSIVWIA